MNDIKNVFASKTILTSIVGAIFAVLAAFNVVAIDPQVQASVVAGLFALAGLFRYSATEQLVVGSTTL